MDDQGAGRVVRQQAALLQLARMDLSDYEASLRMIAEVDARLLGLERVSIWLFTPDGRDAGCELLYTLSTNTHDRGARLEGDSFPRYFAAIREGRAVAADDAKTDPRTAERAPGHLDPLKIVSTLDTPIRHHGKVRGFVCHEHADAPRTWSSDDISFADSVAGLVGMCLEVAERKRAEDELRQERNFMSAVLDTAGSLVIVLDPAGRIVRLNKACGETLGYAPGDAVGRPFCDVFLKPEDAADVETGFERLRDTRGTEQFEHAWLARDQSARRIAWTATVLPGPDTSIRHVVITGVDMTERKALEDQLIHDAFHDALTGLPNRALFMDRLTQCLRHSKRHPHRRYAVLQIDLDRFKIVNDSLGHSTGDRLLIDLCRRIEACVRPGDTVARISGDEFAVLLEGLQDGTQATTVAQRLQERLKAPFRIGGQEIFTTASIGITLSQTGYERPEDVLRDADTALYRAKGHGGARHEVFDKDMHARAVARLELETDLRRAIERGQFSVSYQPVVSLSNGRLRGFEALVRWNHPKRGQIPPPEFIQTSEETGLIIAIDRWVLREASRQLRDWHERYPESQALTMSVNLSGKQFAQPDLAEYVAGTLEETGLPGDRLGLEITESVLMDCTPRTSQLLWDLRSSGPKLLLDDFGTGYSSLGYLHRFPIDTLKIDRSFIGGMKPGGEGREIVKTIVALAQNLDLNVVAEGVETDEQRRALLDMRCEFGQGYVFSRPIAGEQAEELIATSASW